MTLITRIQHGPGRRQAHADPSRERRPTDRAAERRPLRGTAISRARSPGMRFPPTSRLGSLTPRGVRGGSRRPTLPPSTRGPRTRSPTTRGSPSPRRGVDGRGQRERSHHPPTAGLHAVPRAIRRPERTAFTLDTPRQLTPRRHAGHCPRGGPGRSVCGFVWSRLPRRSCRPCCSPSPTSSARRPSSGPKRGAPAPT
jgi:hypothetical protein